MINEEAIKVMNTIIAGVKHNIQLPMTVNDIEDACYMAIEALNEQKPHGEWNVRNDTMYHFECPFCKYLHQYKDNFCPLCGASMIPSNSEVENPCKTCTKYIGNMCEHVCEKRYEYIKVGNTIYTQDDDKQGWTGREVK